MQEHETITKEKKRTNGLKNKLNGYRLTTNNFRLEIHRIFLAAKAERFFWKDFPTGIVRTRNPGSCTIELKPFMKNII